MQKTVKLRNISKMYYLWVRRLNIANSGTYQAKAQEKGRM